jgi:4'-phosphopantetheinyl transferase EntD
MCSAPETDLLPLPSGAPYVPPGARGSISHKNSLAFAIVAPGDAPCGIDIEEIEERDAALVQRIMTARERAADRSAATASLYYSAKEAIYKLLPFDMQPAIDFEDIELMPSHEADGWTELQGLVDGSLPVRVRAYITENLCLAVATLL